MKVLWITNTVFPEALQLLGKGDGKLTGSGGWMLSLAAAISDGQGVRLVVCSVSHLVDRLKRLEGQHIVYYLLPKGRKEREYDKKYEAFWKAIQEKEKPDVIHVHGTEFPYGLSYINACGNKHVVVSVQGVVYAIAKYYTAGITNMEILRSLTLRDMFGRTIWHEKKRFEKQARLEKETLEKCNHIIGRTAFDRAYIESVNPAAHYYKCNETLRDEFYSGTWDEEKCKKHVIFLSQGWYPLKGVHQVLKAMPFILKRYPDAVIRIAGPNIMKACTVLEKARLSGYANYLRKTIKSLGIEGRIVFTGPLSANGIRDELLSCNVFVCPSSIENSSNSLAEAQILGVPCIASYVGGAPSMMKGDEEHLYRFEDFEMMAMLIMEVFKGEGIDMSIQSLARIRHDANRNLEALLNIYNIVYNE